MEKFTYGVLIVLNRQCLQCEYRHQWKSQVNASIPTAEGQQLTGGTEVDLETVETDRNPTTTTAASEDPPVSDEESDVVDESEESGDGDMDLDEDWNSSDSEKGIYSEEDDPVALENSQLCTDCGKFFSKRKHHTCEHKIKPFSCNVCGKRCVNEAALNCHNRIHDENYEHPCKFCHVTFKTKPDKITHEQTHINDATPYKCPDCSDTFATSKRLRIHRRIHGERHLNCHICGIRFYRPLSLRRHLAVHTGDKPHKCSVCERGFNQAGHLKSHMRLHTGERPFKCQHCDKSFNHNVSLKSHVQRYHTPNSGSKKGEINYSVGDEAELDNVEEQHDKQEKVQRKKKGNTHRSTGRPVGRPKRNAEGNLEEIQDQCSNTKSAKVKVRKLKKTRCHDESEDELTESDVCFDQTEEEERTEKETRSTRKSRSRAQNSNSESDFEPEDSKKKRHSSPSKNSIC
uniref:zinc finger protein 658B-like n=1 Tax=Semicossyphus pulcher TaxID=241346 RepID=UPI0037E7D908